MHDSFDPYQHWLAIPPSEQPPNHYRLLGLKLLEGNQAIITRAVQLRIDHVRACNDGRHPELVKQILDQIEAAKCTLLNPKLKGQYDYLMRKRFPQATVSAAPATPPPANESSPPGSAGQGDPAPVVGPAFQPDPAPAEQPAAGGVMIVTEARNGNKAVQRKPASLPHLVLGGVAGGLVVLALLLVWVASRSPSEAPPSADGSDRGRVTGRSDRQQGASRPAAGGGSRDDRHGGSSSSGHSGARRPRGPETLADLMNQGDDGPPDTSTVTGMLAAARGAMVGSDRAAARRHVEAALDAARSSTERAEARRVEKLLRSLELFWKAVRTEVGQLEGGEELQFDDAMAIVVEADNREILIRAFGRNRRYAVDALPAKLAIALARRRLPRKDWATELHVGSYLAVDPRGDRHEARMHWERAGAEGKSLLPELALLPSPQVTQAETPPTASPTDKPAPATPADGPAGVADGPKPPVARRVAVPDENARSRAEAQVRDVFRNDFSRARSIADKKLLARKLFDAAGQTADNPAARYAMYRLARDLAVEVGDPDSICRVVDEMSRHYRIDALGMKAEGVATAWRSAQDVTYRLALVRHALELLDAAEGAKNYAAADRVVGVAISGARAAKDYRLVRQLEDRARQIKASLRTAG